eukprot:TRINITY_DN23920_c0_g1_i1.p1 TRINITY_DN23920_c0_g1~~TRINITY_DN23920_c0_g1_i1.p1  ORF type:complete len:364 (+),score=60.95 TRINITY_DN23920_c0_g1_i1:105-1196(+)
MAEIAIDPARSVCPECGGGAGPPVLDNSTGDLVCTGCGLVLQGQCLDEGQEWRSFGVEGVSSGAHHNSRERGGGGNQLDALFGNARFVDGTAISGSDAFSRSLQKMQRMSDETSLRSHLSVSDRYFKKYCGKIKEACGWLHISETIERRGTELVRVLGEKNLLSPKHPVGWILAIIFLACKEEHAARTDLELARVGAQHTGRKEADVRKEIAASIRQLSKTLAGEIRTGHTQHVETEELMARFVSRLWLSREVCEPANHITRQAWKLGLGARLTNATQSAISASAIFLVSWLMDVEKKPTLAEVSSAVQVPEAAVKTSYAEMRPLVSRLLADLPSFRCALPGGLDQLPQSTVKVRGTDKMQLR